MRKGEQISPGEPTQVNMNPKTSWSKHSVVYALKSVCECVYLHVRGIKQSWLCCTAVRVANTLWNGRRVSRVSMGFVAWAGKSRPEAISLSPPPAEPAQSAPAARSRTHTPQTRRTGSCSDPPHTCTAALLSAGDGTQRWSPGLPDQPSLSPTSLESHVTTEADKHVHVKSADEVYLVSLWLGV